MKSKLFIYPIILLMALSIACSMTVEQPGTATPIIQPSETPIPLPAATNTEIPPTPPQITFDGKLTCTQAGVFTKCLDGVLRIEYEYPTEWGVLDAKLRKGLTAGSTYDYSFDENRYIETIPLAAGGRSKDFSEGRDGFVTDFYGYIPGDPDRDASCSAGWHKQYALCQNVNPNLTWMIYFPDASTICTDPGGPGYSITPIFRVEINLPDNPTINGFVWQAPFLSEAFSKQLNSDFYPLLGIDADMMPGKCDAASQQKFDAQRAIYLEQIKKNTAEAGTQEKLDEITHFINSIIFR